MPEKALIFIIAVLLIFGGVYKFRGSFPTLVRGLAPERKQESAQPASSAPQPTAVKPKRTSRPSRAASGVEERQIAAFDVAVHERVRAQASDIPLNLPLPDLIAKFGEPDLTASWSSGGKLNRKLIYANDGRTLEVNVQNGRVVSKRD